MHINQPVYVVGETIWYKVYQTNYHQHEDHSEVLFLNLHNKKGDLLQQKKLKLDSGRAHGSLNIPLIFQEGYYYLTCFTKWNLQFSENSINCTEIPIYNPFSGSIKSSEISQPENIHGSLQQSTDIKIILDTGIYSRREMVNLDIISELQINGKFSITVHALHNLNTSSIIKSNPKYDIHEATEKQKSLLIEGSITDPNSATPVFSDVISFYKVNSNQFVKASSISGQVEIPITELVESAQFQVFNMNPFQTSIPKFELSITGEKLKDVNIKTLYRNKSVSKYLSEVVKNQKVQEIFNPGNRDSIQRISSGFLPFKPDKVYEMDKYHQVKSLEEFFREVVAFARVKTEDDQPTVRLKNRETNREFMEKPWYLVDGYLTRDEQKVLSIPFKNLVKIEIFETNKSIFSQLDAIMIRGGFIVVYTNNDFMKSTCESLQNIFDFNGFSATEHFDPKINNEVNFRENPIFKYHLYWNPDIFLKDKKSISFQTSDLMGEFLIEVIGISEQGELHYTSEKFLVEF